MNRIGSMFSGIDGIALGLEWAGAGELVWACDSDPEAREVLATHWPHAIVYDDVRTLDHSVPQVDILCGGFPCQDLSHAGKRAGIDGSRSGLWRELIRVTSFVHPKWVVVENIHHGWRDWVPVLRSALHDIGYASVPLQLSAAEVGALHRRNRVFLVANVDSECVRLLSRRFQEGQ